MKKNEKVSKISVGIDVNTKQLDGAIEKAKELVSLLERANKSIDSLRNNDTHECCECVKKERNMNIQEAIREGMKQKKMIKRESWKSPERLIPTNDGYNRIVGYMGSKETLPYRGWQPKADDLTAEDWFVTDESYQNLILSM